MMQGHMLSYVGEEKLREGSSAIVRDGDRVSNIRVDVTVESDVKRLHRLTVERTGKIDILVDNADLMRFGKLDETDPSVWDMLMRTNVYAPWRLMVAVLPEMCKAGGGSIINISSIAGLKAFPSVGLYCTSKPALQMLSQVMAMEVASDNIRVNLICPPVVEDTELSVPIFGEENVSEFYDNMRPLHPLDRNANRKTLPRPRSFWHPKRAHG